MREWGGSLTHRVRDRKKRMLSAFRDEFEEVLEGLGNFGAIDGFVYLGSGAQAFLYGRLLPKDEAAKVAANWAPWPGLMIPVALVGLLLCTRVWNARPAGKGAAAH